MLEYSKIIEYSAKQTKEISTLNQPTENSCWTLTQYDEHIVYEKLTLNELIVVASELRTQSAQ
jgi:hypothetical protein